MNETNAVSYKSHFDRQTARSYAKDYENPSSYSALLWTIERAQLSRLVQQFRANHNCIDYLDFATGTGRVLSFLENQVDNSTGIEISPEMLAIAEGKLTRSKLLCKDITVPEALPEGQYDLITAFRFVLNAEPDLRFAALRALRARLRDHTSWLVFNNHGNFWSHKALLWPYRTLKHGVRTRPVTGNYLSHREVLQLAREAGLEAKRVDGCGVLSAKALKLVSFEMLARCESRIASTDHLTWLGANQLYVARKLP